MASTPRIYTEDMVYNHMFNGWVFLTSDSEFKDVDAGQSPEGRYVGFKVLEDGTVIDSVTFSQNSYEFAPDSVGEGETPETVSDIPLIAGETYWMLIDQIKLTSGSIILINS